jgi:hypothetical protein
VLCDECRCLDGPGSNDCFVRRSDSGCGGPSEVVLHSPVVSHWRGKIPQAFEAGVETDQKFLATEFSPIQMWFPFPFLSSAAPRNIEG